MWSPRTILVLLGVTGALIAVMVHRKRLDDSEAMPLFVWVVWLVVIAGTIIRTFRSRLSNALQAALVWAVIVLALVRRIRLPLRVHRCR
jgi:predicted aspartyl protease